MIVRRITVGAAALLLFGASRASPQVISQSRDSSSETLGTVHFGTSCSPAVSARFDRAVALLHSFEFGASIRAFQEVLAVDSSCAMAHWGLAMSRWGNPVAPGPRSAAQLGPGRAAADEGMRLAARATDRERGYIAAVARLYADHERVDQRVRVAMYERAMADVVARHPEDSEAAIFHALALVATALPADKTYANQLRAGAIFEGLWSSQPEHPGIAHYIIHSYDYPPLAGKAREAAQRYSRIAPSAAHALHMPSHTFTRVGLWNESIETNRRSMVAAVRSGSIAEALHAADYMVYAHLQMRQTTKAKALLDTLPALATSFDPNAVTGAAPGSAGVFALAAIPARYALERRDWEQAARLVPAPSAFPWTEAMVYFARALGASHTGDLPIARAAVDTLAAIEHQLLARDELYWAEQVGIQRLAAQAWVDHAENRHEAALRGMTEAAQREDATDKSAVTPGPLAPAREQLGDLLLALGRPRDALAEYRLTLRSEPNRYHTLEGARRAAEAVGDREAAADYAAQLRRIAP